MSVGVLDNSNCFDNLGNCACGMSWTTCVSCRGGSLSTIAYAIDPTIITPKCLPIVLMFIRRGSSAYDIHKACRQSRPKPVVCLNRSETSVVDDRVPEQEALASSPIPNSPPRGYRWCCEQEHTMVA
jgi:hypothetical protein